jgi:hypothetical protein
MRRLKSFLVVIALAFALPLQGFAAASAGLCMVMGHHGEHGHASHSGDQDSHLGSLCGSCFDCCASIALTSIDVVHVYAAPAPGPVAFDPLRGASLRSAPPDRPPLAL